MTATSTRPAAVVVLAAGEGTRMRSATPKVLHEIGGRSLLGHAVAAAQALEPAHLVVVVGHGREPVIAHLADIAPDAGVAVQDQQLGTGHAVQCALAELPPLEGVVVVTYADTPLLAGETLGDLLRTHVEHQDAVTLLSADVTDPSGYGRVVRDASGAVTGIVEHKDASDDERAISEINSGIYAFDAVVLRDALGRLSTDNAQGELYVTDVVAIARSEGRQVAALRVADTWQTEGVNDRVQLAAMRRELNARILDRWMRDGVTVVDPATTWIDVTVELDRDVTLLPGVQLHGTTRIAEGASVGPDSTLVDCQVGRGARVVRTHATGATIGDDSDVGPFSYLRPGTVLGAHGKIGAFVEVKASSIGDGSKVPHLSYVGDATIGEQANIGAATVFVNYDGVQKHKSVVGDFAKVGSDTMLIAPVTVGDGAYTAAGSVITEDVPPGAMAVARGRQHNVEGWVARKRPGTPSCCSSRSSARAADWGRRRHPHRRQGGQRVSAIEVQGKKKLMLFSGRAHPELADQVAAQLDVTLTPTKAFDFANGEIYVRFEESVRGSDAFVIQSHTAPINEWIMEQLLMVDALKRASAKRITVVMPFYGYARQDKKHRGREPISARLIADMFKTAGADRLMAVDLHTAQIQGFFDGPVDHLWALPVLSSYIAEKYDTSSMTVVSPDAGRVRVADMWTDKLGASLAIIHKRRDPNVANEVKVHEVVGDVEGRTCLVVDDMIDTAGTICKAADALFDSGAAEVIVAATHAVLSGPAVDRLKNSRIREVVVTNTLPIPPDRHFDSLTALSIAPLIARAVKEVFEDGSVTSLFGGNT